MATAKTRPYRHLGVFLPYIRRDPVETTQWAHRANLNIEKNGFILVSILGPCIYLVQSVETGDLFINKIFEHHDENPYDPNSGLHGYGKGHFPFDLPIEMRISSWPNAANLVPGDATYLQQLDLWQRLDNEYWSIYLRYYNGGSLLELMERYDEEGRRVPEHFIWHVIEQVSLAIAWMKFGGTTPVAGWKEVYHRDLVENNIFIHYPSSKTGKPPGEGYMQEVFPDIIVGDFGDSEIDGDPPNLLRGGAFPGQDPADWEDIYLFGEVIRKLAVCHIPDQFYQDINSIRIADVNKNMLSGDPKYSDALISVLQRFEFDNMENTYIDANQDLGDGNGMQPNYTRIPNAAWLVNTLLPFAQARVEAYKNPTSGDPRPVWWFQNMSVAWTKPQSFMPFEFDQRYGRNHRRYQDGTPVGQTEDDDGKEVEPGVRTRMDMLRYPHMFNQVKPRYRVCSLESQKLIRAAVKPANRNPPPPAS